MKKMNFNRRRFKYGSMATVITAGFIVLVVLVNIIFSLVLARFPSKIDLTEENMYEITADSIEYVEAIEDEVNIYICTTEDILDDNEYYRQAKEIIEEYTRYNSNIKISYVDLLEDAAFSREYADYGVTSGMIIIDSGKRVKAVTIASLFASMENSETGETKIVSQTEQIMTSALAYVCDDQVMSATIIYGTSDTDVSGFTAMLEENNYEISEISIATDDISLDSNIAVIYAPMIDYTEEQIKKLDTYLDNDGNFGRTLIYIASYDQPELPNLEAFLKEWGIEFEDAIILETDTSNVYSSGQNYVFGVNFPVQEDETVDYTENLRDETLPYIAFSARALTASFSAEGNRYTTSILTTNDTAVLMPFDADESYNMNNEPQQTYNVALMGARTKQLDGDNFLTSSNVLVFSGADMFNTSITTSASYNNNEYTMSVVNKIAGKEADSITIADVSFTTTSLQITSAQYNAITIVFIFIVPIGLLLTGIIVWLRRRNK